jgi:hypothetical protein
VFHCEQTGPAYDFSAGILEPRDIVVFCQGGYCCGY